MGTREQIWGWYSVRSGQGETMYRDTAVARSGLASAAVTTGGGESEGAGWLMRLDELPLGHVVHVEGYAKTEGLVGAAYLKITLETREEGVAEPLVLGWAYTDSPASDDEWALLEVNMFVPPEATGVWLEAGMRGRGRAWFDDLSLVVEEADSRE